MLSLRLQGANGVPGLPGVDGAQGNPVNTAVLGTLFASSMKGLRDKKKIIQILKFRVTPIIYSTNRLTQQHVEQQFFTYTINNISNILELKYLFWRRQLPKMEACENTNFNPPS